MTLRYFYNNISFVTIITEVVIEDYKRILYHGYFDNIPNELWLRRINSVTYNDVMDKIIFKIF